MMPQLPEASNECDYDVVIVGGGPTGLNLALTLCTNGVDASKIKIIEKRSDRKSWCKAAALHPRSMELFYSNSEEICDTLLDRGLKLSDLTLGSYDHDIKPLFVSLSDRIDSTFPYITGVEQWYIEECLENVLKKKYNLNLDRGVELIDFNDNINSYVDATIACNGSNTQLTCKYLIGCDGGKSRVRSKLGIEFSGNTYDEAFILVEAELEKNDKFDVNNIDIAAGYKINPSDKGLTSNIVNGKFKGTFVRVGENGWLFGISLPLDKWYIGANIRPHEYSKYSRDENGYIRADTKDWNEILSKRGLGMMKIKGEPLWLSSFFISNKITRYYSNNNHVFLCGDACHVHSPLGGQGMNMGLQDAQNLGWKLALVLKNVCNSNLLNSYECERRSVDETILRNINNAHGRISSVSTDSRHVQTYFLSRLFSIVDGKHFAFLQSIFATQATQLGYSYRSTKNQAVGGQVDLIMDYWIRPSFLSFDFFGNVLKRRQQNITRVVRSRYDLKLLSSGDRVPNFHLMNADSTLESTDVAYNELYKLFRKFEFVILLFEGDSAYTETKYYRNEKELVGIKENIESDFAGDKICQNFIRVLIVGKEDEHVNRLFGVKGQCLVLIRNDHFIGLRSEPISIKALKYYFVNKLKIEKIRYNAEYDALEDEHSIANTLDWAAATVLSGAMLIGIYFLNKRYGWTQKLPKVRLTLEW